MLCRQKIFVQQFQCKSTLLRMYGRFFLVWSMKTICNNCSHSVCIKFTDLRRDDNLIIVYKISYVFPFVGIYIRCSQVQVWFKITGSIRMLICRHARMALKIISIAEFPIHRYIEIKQIFICNSGYPGTTTTCTFNVDFIVIYHLNLYFWVMSILVS